MRNNKTSSQSLQTLFTKSVICLQAGDITQAKKGLIQLSNYFQVYGSDVGFVYNLESLTEYYIRYHRLMARWKAMFGDEIYNVVYEDLVSDVENKIRQLVDAVNLPWEDNCLDQKRSDTIVRTASIWQVRQGIYTRSKERWRNYQAHLQPCIAILVRAGILDDAGNWLERA